MSVGILGTLLIRTQDATVEIPNLRELDVTDGALTQTGPHTADLSTGGALPTSCFVIDLTGPHQTLGFSANDSHPLIWDPVDPPFDSWDDIGFPTDYSTIGQGGFFIDDIGDYLVTVSAELDPDTAYTIGQFLLGIEYSGSVSNSYQTTQIGVDGNPVQCSVSVLIRAQVGGLADEFHIFARTSGVDDTTFIGKAVVTITKVG